MQLSECALIFQTFDFKGKRRGAPQWLALASRLLLCARHLRARARPPSYFLMLASFSRPVSPECHASLVSQRRRERRPKYYRYHCRRSLVRPSVRRKSSRNGDYVEFLAEEEEAASTFRRVDSAI